MSSKKVTDLNNEPESSEDEMVENEQVPKSKHIDEIKSKLLQKQVEEKKKEAKEVPENITDDKESKS